MIYAFEAYLLLAILFLAKKDADSFLLMQRYPLNLTSIDKEVITKRWHMDGVALYALYILPLLFMEIKLSWQTMASALLIRLTFFDVIFNLFAELKPSYIGGTAKADQFFVRIFGQQGGYKKAAVFLALFIALQFFI